MILIQLIFAKVFSMLYVPVIGIDNITKTNMIPLRVRSNILARMINKVQITM